MKTVWTFLAIVLAMSVFACQSAFGRAVDESRDDFAAAAEDKSLDDIAGANHGWGQGYGWRDGRGQGMGPGLGIGRGPGRPWGRMGQNLGMMRPGRGWGRSGQGWGYGPGQGWGYGSRGRGQGSGPMRQGQGWGWGWGHGQGQGWGYGGRGRGPAPMRRGQGWGSGQGQGRGVGRGMGPGGQGGNRGMRRSQGGRGGSGQVNPEELLEFLEKHEPKLAKKTKKLREEDPGKFRRQVLALGRLYGPVMRHLDANPKMGKLMLKKIRLKENIGRAVKKAKEGSDKKAKEQLTKNVSNLFDVIIAQNELRIKNVQERITTRNGDEKSGKAVKKGRGRKKVSDAAKKGKVGKKVSAKGKRGRGPRGDKRQQVLNRFLKDIESWKANKDKIVKQRVRELLQGVKPFPWR